MAARNTTSDFQAAPVPAGAVEGAGTGDPTPSAVVGLGASAGGLDALRTLLGGVPASSGLAWVVAMHRSPAHESPLAELLAPHTPLPVQPVTETVRLERDRVYVIPPDAKLSAGDSQLRVERLGGGTAPPSTAAHSTTSSARSPAPTEAPPWRWCSPAPAATGRGGWRR